MLDTSLINRRDFGVTPKLLRDAQVTGILLRAKSLYVCDRSRFPTCNLQSGQEFVGSWNVLLKLNKKRHGSQAKRKIHKEVGVLEGVSRLKKKKMSKKNRQIKSKNYLEEVIQSASIKQHQRSYL